MITQNTDRPEGTLEFAISGHVSGADYETVLIPAIEKALESDLPPDGPSFITRVCGSGFHILRLRFGQARRARSPQIAQASGALVRGVGCQGMSAA